MATATQQKAKQLSQQWWDNQASQIGKRGGDPMQNFVDDRSNQMYQQGKADYWQQYNTQLNDANRANDIAWNRKRNAQINDAEDNRSFQKEMAAKDHTRNLEMARFNRYGNENITGSYSVSKTDFNPENTMQMRMFREQNDAEAQRAARDNNAQVDMFNRQNAAKSQSDANARVYEAGQRDKDRALSMQQSMWNSLSGAGQYNYRYW